MNCCTQREPSLGEVAIGRLDWLSLFLIILPQVVIQIRSDEGLTLETSAFRISVRWPIYIRAVYTRENKPRLTLAAAYIIRERNYLYGYKLPGQDKPQLDKAVNVDFVPFIRGLRVLCKPRPE